MDCASIDAAASQPVETSGLLDGRLPVPLRMAYRCDAVRRVAIFLDVPMTETLGNSFLRALVEDDDEGHLLSRVEPLHLVPNQTVYEADDRVDYIYFPTGGLISVVSVMVSGQTVETSVVGQEGAVGFVEAIGSRIVFSRCFCQVDGDCLRIPAASFRKAYDASPRIRARVADHVELLLSELRQAIGCNALHSASQRLAWWLLECQDRVCGREILPLTQDFLATMMGVQRTTVTQYALQLAEKGVIKTRRGHVHILDRPGLEAEACECYVSTRRIAMLLGQAASEAAGADPRREPAVAPGHLTIVKK